jgi:two-component system chemotaxis sensor kinase CheA
VKPEQLAARLLATFVDELDEQLKTLDADLLALERDPADAEHLRSVFRVMHTLKGASRAAGVRAIEEVCHALETLGASARDSGAPLAASQIALLFAGADALADAGQRLRDGTDAATSPALGELLVQLRRQAAAPPRGAGHAAAVARVVPMPTPADPGPAKEAAVQPAVGATPVAPSPVQAREDQVRVSVRQMESLLTATGELLGISGTVGERPSEATALAEAVRVLRAEWRRTAGPSRRALERAGASSVLLGAVAAIDERLAQIDRTANELARELGDDVRSLGGTTSRLVDGLRRLRTRPFHDLAEALPRAARDIAVSVGKSVELVVEGQDVEADRTVLDALREPLLHLVRNAVDHGIETPPERTRAGKPAAGTVRVTAALRGDRLTVSVADDGAGLDIAAIREALAQRSRAVPEDDHDVARALFESGFSTRREATAISGRGVGLDIVRDAVQRMGGTVDVAWEPGQGTTFTIETPVSVATLGALLVVAGGQTFALPTAFVERLARVKRDAIRHIEGRTVLAGDGAPLPLASLARLLGPPLVETPMDGDLTVVILAAGGRKLAVAVDEVIEERAIVVRPLEHTGESAGAHFAGAALLDGTRVALVVNVAALAATGARATGRDATLNLSTRSERRRARVLVVDDSITTRTLEQSVLAAAGYDVSTAVDGEDAWRMIEEMPFDIVITDVEMPRLDGLELCERIRATPARAGLPVILVTSLDKPEQRARGLEAGADAYITKSSFDQDTLLTTVRQLIGEIA